MISNSLLLYIDYSDCSLDKESYVNVSLCDIMSILCLTCSLPFKLDGSE